jgi:NAD(P)-dependent dehydrogenase (short-subunit alcohol dehydrogenase family)
VRLQGKVAIVTGAGSGIGRAITRGFAAEGARVLAADIRLEAAQETCAMSPPAGSTIALQADVSRAADAQRMVAAAVERFGRLDVLVNNAAIQLIGQDAPCHELDEDVWERTMAVNLRGPFLCTKHALPELIRAGGGSIVNIASPTGFDKGAGYTAYATSKGGLSTLTRVVALDYAGHKVRCNAIVPGATETPLIASLLDDPDVRARLERLSPLGRLGQPQDLVPLAIYLASDESAFSTGAHFFADGGAVLH